MKKKRPTAPWAIIQISRKSCLPLKFVPFFTTTKILCVLFFQFKFRYQESSSSFGASIYDANRKHEKTNWNAANAQHNQLIAITFGTESNHSTKNGVANSVAITFKCIFQSWRTTSDQWQSFHTKNALQRHHRSAGLVVHFLAVHCIDDISLQCLGHSVAINVPISNARKHKHLAGRRFLCGCHLFIGRGAN